VQAFFQSYKLNHSRATPSWSSWRSVSWSERHVSQRFHPSNLSEELTKLATYGVYTRQLGCNSWIQQRRYSTPCGPRNSNQLIAGSPSTTPRCRMIREYDVTQPCRRATVIVKLPIRRRLSISTSIKFILLRTVPFLQFFMTNDYGSAPICFDLLR
jgi:hypothetical protein